MKLSFRNLSLVSCAALLVVAAGTASAQVSGTVYTNIDTAPVTPPGQGSSYATNGVTYAEWIASGMNGSAFSTGPSYTFTSNKVDFYAPGVTGTANPTNNSLSGFLTSQGASVSGNALTSGALATGNLIVLTDGNVDLVNGTTYTLMHDDGVDLYVSNGSFSGDIYNSPGQTTASSSQTFLFTGPTGQYDATLLYVSNYEAPSELEASGALLTTFGSSPTPEPSSFVLLGSGLLAAAGMIRRRMTV